ncbi:Eight transmembrane protein EpsH / EpsI protein [Olavius algarvensis associated proteobacterium Delta 3]|nr:Eight transmembrane protein EpsH / EpsI protein [Olavius algarvensis associated proteobacterium Delta 3]CAB5154711.1 Eight transmembrane protein EpsH / EpsI protein [Olavius algarvensis associated proteobacterium Delta 3]
MKTPTVKESINALTAIRPVHWAKFIVYGLLLIGIYYSTYIWLITQDWSRDDYSASYLIPFVFLYLLWEKKEALQHTASKPSWSGLWFVSAGLILFWLGELSGEFFSLYLSSWLVLVGICWVHLGWPKLKEIGFPLFILLAMFPLPHFLYDRVSFELKLISSRLGVWTMQIFGMSAYREGNIIDLGFTQLQVVDACSGLRYLIPLIVLGLLVAHFFKGALWKRVFLVLSTVPIAIFVNGMRVASVGILYQYFGRGVAEGFFHDFSGWLIFMVSLAILLGEMVILKRIGATKFQVQDTRLETQRPGNRRERDEEGNSNEDSRSIIAGAAFQKSETPEPSAIIQNPARQRRASIQNTRSPRWREWLIPPQFAVLILLLGATLAFASGIEFREKVPATRPFTQFPMEIDQWTGKTQRMEQIFIDELDLSDYAIVNFRNTEGKFVNFYVAYYQSQSKGESIHSPTTCLPGSGWQFNQAGTLAIPADDHGNSMIRVRRAFMQKGEFRQLAYFWFPMRGRILTNAYEMKLFNFWDALTRHRTDGALVRLITPVYDDEKTTDAEKRLQSFTKSITPILAEFLPQ